MVLYNNFYKLSFPNFYMEFRRKVAYAGLVALLGFTTNLVGNMAASSNYDSLSNGIRELGRQADKRVVGFEEAVQFIDPASPEAQKYRTRLEALRKEAEDLHAEAARWSKASEKYARRAFVVGYFSG